MCVFTCFYICVVVLFIVCSLLEPIVSVCGYLTGALGIEVGALGLR